MKHSRELLDSIWKQRRKHWLQIHKPDLEIHIHPADWDTIRIECGSGLWGPEEFIKLFGETTIVENLDTVVGEPRVLCQSYWRKPI